MTAADAEACWQDFHSKVNEIAPQMGITASWKTIESASKETLRDYISTSSNSSQAASIWARNKDSITKKLAGVQRYLGNTNDQNIAVYQARMSTIIANLEWAAQNAN